MINARDVGGTTFVEAVLEVGGRRAAVLDVIKSRSYKKIGERQNEIGGATKNHPATVKIRRIESLQALGHIDEIDAVTAIDYLNDWVPNAPQEENPKSF